MNMYTYFFQLIIKIVNTSNLKIKVLYHPISLSPITILSNTASVGRKVSIESFIMYRIEFYLLQPAKLFFCILFPYEIIARASLLKFHRAICKQYSCRGDILLRCKLNSKSLCLTLASKQKKFQNYGSRSEMKPSHKASYKTYSRYRI